MNICTWQKGSCQWKDGHQGCAPLLSKDSFRLIYNDQIATDQKELSAPFGKEFDAVLRKGKERLMSFIKKYSFPSFR